jgi:hypothetical protein
MEDFVIFIFLMPCFAIYLLIGVFVIWHNDDNDLFIPLWPLVLFYRIVKWIIGLFEKTENDFGDHYDSYHGGLC